MLKRLQLLQSEVGRASLLLGGFALFGVIVLALLNAQTKPLIAANEKQALLQQLNTLVPANRYNNELTQANILLNDEKTKHYFSAPEGITVYLARQHTQPVAAIFIITTLQGYSGAIKLIIAVNHDQSLAGVRVLSHKETPGLGDKIDAKKDDWILNFTGKSLQNPSENAWAVKKDGGEFDQFTGATITPRAVVAAVKKTLIWSEANLTTLFNHPETFIASTANN
ncbi:MAG: electron transport complex subunit RsxG [bacterium]